MNVVDRKTSLVIENGEKVKPTFSKEEMERRIVSLRKHMAETGIDATLFTSHHNINYYSDFLYTAYGRSYGLLVTKDKHITISANIDGGQPWRRSFGDNIVYTDWRRDNFFSTIKTILNKAGLDRGRLGVEDDHIVPTVRNKIQDALPLYELVDISQATMERRMIKSQEEIELIRKGTRIAEIGGKAMIEAIDEGVPEYEIVLHGTEVMTREIARIFPHTELRDTYAWFQSGINTDGAHNWPTTRALQKGDILSLNCFPIIAGYFTALERTLFLKEVSDRNLELWEINCKVHKRGLELIKPGAVCMDIAKELNEIYEENNLLENRTCGYGHSFGILAHYYGREGGLELREDVETVLKPGMVISLEPMIMIPEGQQGAGGYKEHDILVINEDGVENLTADFPVGPNHNIINK